MKVMTNPSYYTLDARNRIIDAGGGWDAFAESNGAEAAKRSCILGHDLWDFVDGVDTRSFLNAVFFMCRRYNMPFSWTYRCDSPTERRLFEMQVTPSEDERITVRHVLLDASKGRNIGDVANVGLPRSACRCSVCCRFRVGDSWVDPFREPDRAFVADSHTLCPDCRSALLRGLEAAARNASHVMDLAIGA